MNSRLQNQKVICMLLIMVKEKKEEVTKTETGKKAAVIDLKPKIKD